MIVCVVFVSSRRRHTRCGRDWSSDVCSSDLAAEAPDAVLLDVQLPDGDGFSVATALMGAGGPAVVLISSRAAEDYGKRIEACGARGFILKSRLSAAAFGALVQ